MSKLLELEFVTESKLKLALWNYYYYFSEHFVETNEEKAARLEKDRVRKVSARSVKTDEEKAETDEVKAARLEKDRVRKAAARSVETIEDKAARLEKDRVRKTLARQRFPDELKNHATDPNHAQLLFYQCRAPCGMYNIYCVLSFTYI